MTPELLRLIRIRAEQSTEALTEATPAGRSASFPMADVTFQTDNEVRNVPQMIVFIHPDELPTEPTLFEGVEWGA